MHPCAAHAWPSLCAGLALAAGLAWFAPREALDWQAQQAWTQPWRCWTAALVHLSPLHLGANLLGCAVVAAFGIAARLPPRATGAWLVAWPLGHIALSVQPQLLHYAGLSGVLHAGVAVAATHLVGSGHGQRRAVGAMVLAGLAIKLALEQPWAGPTQVIPGWDFRVAALAHLTGAVAGLLCGAVAEAVAARRASGSTLAH